MKNQANNFLVKLLLYALGYGLLAYAASRTLDFIQKTMPPDKQWWGYLFLLATGGGAVIWQQVFMRHAHGAKRRGVSFGMAVVDLLGEFAMVYADTMTTSAEAGMIQQINPDFLRTFILASVGIIGLNIMAFFFYELWDPEKEQERRAQDIGDGIEAEAMKMLASPTVQQDMIARHSPEIQAAIMAKVAQVIAERFTGPTSTYTQPAGRTTQAPRPQLQAPQNDPYALPCGHNQGAAWDSFRKVWACRVCNAPFLADQNQDLQPLQQTSYHPIDLTPKAPAAPKYDNAWRNSTDISPTLDAYAWECLGCTGSNRSHTKTCQWCGQPRTNASPVTAIADIPPAGQAQKSPQEAPKQKTIFDFPGMFAHILERKPQEQKKQESKGDQPSAGPFPAS